jgi:hypothetical protein
MPELKVLAVILCLIGLISVFMRVWCAPKLKRLTIGAFVVGTRAFLAMVWGS